MVKIGTNTTIIGQKHGQMDNLITTTTIFNPKTNKKTFTKVKLNNANFGDFMRIFLQKCEAKAKRATKLFMRCEAMRSEANSLRFAFYLARPKRLMKNSGDKIDNTFFTRGHRIQRPLFMDLKLTLLYTCQAFRPMTSLKIRLVEASCEMQFTCLTPVRAEFFQHWNAYCSFQ